jgi:hypothetical protein
VAAADDDRVIALLHRPARTQKAKESPAAMPPRRPRAASCPSAPAASTNNVYPFIECELIN